MSARTEPNITYVIESGAESFATSPGREFLGFTDLKFPDPGPEVCLCVPDSDRSNTIRIEDVRRVCCCDYGTKDDSRAFDNDLRCTNEKRAKPICSLINDYRYVSVFEFETILCSVFEVLRSHFCIIIIIFERFEFRAPIIVVITTVTCTLFRKTFRPRTNDCGDDRDGGKEEKSPPPPQWSGRN